MSRGVRAGAGRSGWAAAIACGLALLSACRETTLGPLPCSTDAACPAGYHCGPGATCAGDVPCLDDAGCCLAERCESGRCRKRTMCSGSSPCGAPGRRCLHGLCVPATCEVDADCPSSQRCLFGLCREGLPCGGHCPKGLACAPLLDRCVATSPAAPPCPKGALAVLDNDADHLQEGCGHAEVALSCRPLPPLAAGDYGWPAELVDAGTSLLVLAYDRGHGDLVLARHDRSPPYERRSLEALAGVPHDAPVVGDPSGPRGGVAAPGPDAGRQLDAAPGPGGVVHVAFRHDTKDAIAYLRLGPGGAVHDRHTIASGSGVGAALAVAVRPDGRPVVVAFAHAGADHPSALTLYDALSAHPAAAAEWEATALASAALPPPPLPCGGGCKAGTTCVLLPAGGGGGASEACVKVGGGCPLCLPSEVCSGGMCLTRRLPPPPLGRPPAGIGAHVDVLARGADVHVAAWDSLTGRLHLFRLRPGAPAEALVVSGQDVPGGSGDVGRFPHLWVDGAGRVVASCQDAAAGRLLLVRRGPPLQVVVSDDGVREDGHHRVGADVRIRATGGGGVLAVYQDTRRGRTVVASLGPDGVAGTRLELSGEGASGFSSGIVALGNKALVVSTTALSLSSGGGLSTRVRLQSVVLSGR